MSKKHNKKSYPQDTKFLDSIEPINNVQDQYWTSLLEPHPDTDFYDGIIAAYGSAGTGKTFIAAAIAAKLYLRGIISNIVITRPMVEAQQENIGALPGGLGEKFDPWVSNITGMIAKMIGKGKFECDYKNGNIKIEPVSFMRGKTFDNAFIIVDEAQNLTKENLKMVTTRTGQNARCILCGDTDQVDLPPRVQSGLRWFVEEVKRQNRPIDLIEFKSRDCVRSITAKLCLELYDAAS